MNMHTTIPPADTAAAIWADACRDRAAMVRNPLGFIRLAEMLSRFERNDMEAAVDMLIETLDRLDGDADAEPVDEREPDDEIATTAHGSLALPGSLEDDEDDDPAGGAEEAEIEQGGWWEVINQIGIANGISVPTSPVYDIDQSKGPINERQAHRDHYEEMMR